jgi:uncharacterized delta-60 repeat protein
MVRKSRLSFATLLPWLLLVALVVLLVSGACRAPFASAGVQPPLLGDFARAAAMAPDGKMVVAGWRSAVAASKSSVLTQLLVVRFARDGRLDPSFGTGGEATTSVPFAPAEHEPHALVVQPDGRIVVGGGALLRYREDGSLDPSFGQAGIVSEGLGWGILGLALQPDGKILAVVNGKDPAGLQLERFRSDGILDTAFGTGGTVQAPGAVVAVQPDGRIIVSGSHGLTRYLPDGSLDPGFGRDGIASAITGADVAVQADGKIVVAGVAYPGTRALELARYDQRGRLDPSFGEGGAVIAPTPSLVVWEPLAIQPDGKIVVGGYARFRPDGSLDTSFSGGMLEDSPLGSPFAVGLQSSGEIVVGGGAGSLNGEQPAAVGLLPDGRLDSSSANGGGRTGPSDQELYSIDLQRGSETNVSHNLAIDTAPAVSPDGRRIAFLSWRGGEPDIYAMKPDGSDVRRLTNSPLAAGRVADFASDYLEQTTIDWSPDGRRIAFDVFGSAGTWALCLINADGGDQHCLARDARSPSWSPDGRRIAFWGHSDNDHLGAVEVIRADGRGRRRIASGSWPSWSPRSDSIVFTHFRRERPPELDIINADGSGKRRLAYEGEMPGALWSPDGRGIAFNAATGCIDLIRPRGGHAKRLTCWGTLFRRWSPDGRWSPNGRWIAIASQRSHTQLGLIDSARGQTRLITVAPPDRCLYGPLAWSADSRRILVTIDSAYSGGFC